MLKIFGAVLCISAGLITGITVYDRTRREIECLRGLAMAMNVMHSELSTRLTPTPMLMKTVSECSEGCVKKFAEEVCVRTDDLGWIGFDEIWKVCCLQYLKDLSERDLRLISPLGYVLGRAELTEQLSAITATADSLSKRQTEIEKSFAQRKKTCIALPLGVGILVTIMFF